MIAFGAFDDKHSTNYTVTTPECAHSLAPCSSCALSKVMELPLFLMMGFVGGVIGAGFNLCNLRLTQVRMISVHQHKVSSL